MREPIEAYPMGSFRIMSCNEDEVRELESVTNDLEKCFKLADASLNLHIEKVKKLEKLIENMNHEDYGDCILCVNSELSYWEDPCTDCKHLRDENKVDSWEPIEK